MNQKSNYTWCMYKMKLTSSLFLSLLFLGHFSFAQDEKATKLIDGKTGEQIIREYEYWSGIKDDWPNLGHYREANANLLTDTECREPIMGYPDMKSLLCAIRKA